MSEMKYAEIPGVNKPVSKILFGTAIFPYLEGGEDDERFDYVYEMGVTTFDTARNYMLAEKSLGNWIKKRNLRDNIVILSKCGHHDTETMEKRVNEEDMRADLATSLDYLHTSYIDIYLLHRDDPSVPAGDVIEIFNAMHAEGKIGAFGGSNWKHERIAEANEYAYKHNLIPFTVSSPNYGLADQYMDPWGGGCVSISGPAGAAARDWYKKQNMAVLAYSSLGRGMFSGMVKSSDRDKVDKILDEVAVRGYVGDTNFERLRRCEILAAKKNATVAQIAMAYIFSQEMNTFAIVSVVSREQIKANIGALNIELSKSEVAWLDLHIDAL